MICYINLICHRRPSHVSLENSLWTFTFQWLVLLNSCGVLLVLGYHFSIFMQPSVTKACQLFPFSLCSCVGLSAEQWPFEHLGEAKHCLTHFLLVHGRGCLFWASVEMLQWPCIFWAAGRKTALYISLGRILLFIYPSWKTSVLSWKCSPIPFSLAALVSLMLE